MKDLSSSGVYRLYSHNTFFNTSLYTVPEDGWLGLKVGPYTHTWYVSYYDMPEMEVGATLYLTTPDYTFGSILIDATPESDACPSMHLERPLTLCLNESHRHIPAPYYVVDVALFSFSELSLRLGKGARARCLSWRLYHHFSYTDCPTGYGCPCCTAANTTAVTLGSMYDAGYFTISTYVQTVHRPCHSSYVALFSLGCACRGF